MYLFYIKLAAKLNNRESGKNVEIDEMYFNPSRRYELLEEVQAKRKEMIWGEVCAKTGRKRATDCIPLEIMETRNC